MFMALEWQWSNVLRSAALFISFSTGGGAGYEGEIRGYWGVFEAEGWGLRGFKTAPVSGNCIF